MGTGEKHFMPLASSGFLRTTAIKLEEAYKKTEKIKPNKNNTLETFQTISLP